MSKKKIDRLQRENKKFLKLIQDQNDEIKILQNNFKKLKEQNTTRVIFFLLFYYLKK